MSNKAPGSERHRTERRRELPARVAGFLTVFLVLFCSSFTYSAAQTKPLKQIPVIDGEAGPCSVEFTVLTPGNKPVYGANIRVHIEHGFLDLRKLDLEIGTNSDGKARFEGLPDDAHLFFRASKGKAKGVASFNAAHNCHGRHSIVLINKRSAGPSS